MRPIEMPAKTKEPIPTTESILDTLLSLAQRDKRFSRTLCLTAKDVLDRIDAIERQRQARVDRWTKKGDRRPIKAVEKGRATALRRRRQRSAKRSSARRLTQRAEHTARLFPRGMSAAAIVLAAMKRGRWYLRSEIRAVCSELPPGALEALLSRALVKAGGLLEREPNPAWDGIKAFGGRPTPKSHKAPADPSQR